MSMLRVEKAIFTGGPSLGRQAYARRPGRSALRRRLALAARLDVDLDLELVAEGEAAGVERHVEGDAPVLAVEAAGRLEADDLGALHVLAPAGHLDVERDRVADAAHGQVAGHLRPIGALELDPRALERDGRV